MAYSKYIKRPEGSFVTLGDQLKYADILKAKEKLQRDNYESKVLLMHERFREYFGDTGFLNGLEIVYTKGLE